MKYFYTKDFLIKEIEYTKKEWNNWINNPCKETKDVLLQKRADFGLFYTFFQWKDN